MIQNKPNKSLKIKCFYILKGFFSNFEINTNKKTKFLKYINFLKQNLKYTQCNKFLILMCTLHGLMAELNIKLNIVKILLCNKQSFKPSGIHLKTKKKHFITSNQDG